MAVAAGYRSWDPERFLLALEQPHIYGAVYRNGQGRCIGGMMGMVQPAAQGIGPLVADDLGLIVEPASRGSMAAVRLMHDFEDWAKAKGASCVYLAQTTGLAAERTREFCERLGFTFAGYVMKKEL